MKVGIGKRTLARSPFGDGGVRQRLRRKRNTSNRVSSFDFRTSAEISDVLFLVRRENSRELSETYQ